MRSDKKEQEQPAVPLPPPTMPVFVNNVAVTLNRTSHECTLTFLQDAPDLMDPTKLTRDVKGRVVMSVVTLRGLQEAIRQQLLQLGPEATPARDPSESQH